MKIKEWNGMPYHLWNPFTDMDEFLTELGESASVIVRGEGAFVYNDQGDRYINGMSSLWNVALGFGRQEIIEAITKQLQELPYASCFNQTHPRAIELSHKLVNLTNGHYQHVYLGSNGSEAVSAAMKIARQYFKQSPDRTERKRNKILFLEDSFHGNDTHGAMKEDARFVSIKPPYCYRCPFQLAHPSCNLYCADELERTIEREGADSIAAFLLEPIMGDAGIVVPPNGYFKRVAEICRKYNILFIVDEISTGFFRTGEVFLSQSWEIKPDILCLGKGINSGYLPLAATMVTAKIFERFLGKWKQMTFGCTASGHPVCAAAGLANIDSMIKENISENVQAMGGRLMQALQALKQESPIVGDVRGQGLMLGIELVRDKTTKVPLGKAEMDIILKKIKQEGLILYKETNVLCLFPPLIIDESIVDQIIAILEKVLVHSLTHRPAHSAALGEVIEC